MVPSRLAVFRWITWAAAALGIGALYLAIASPMDGWAQSFLFGTGVRWTDAYR